MPALSETSVGFLPGSRSRFSLKLRPGTSIIDGIKPPFTSSQLKIVDSKIDRNISTHHQSTLSRRLQTLTTKSISFAQYKTFDPATKILMTGQRTSDLFVPRSELHLGMSSLSCVPLKELHLGKKNQDFTIRKIVEIKSLAYLMRSSAFETRQDAEVTRHNAYCFGRGFLEPPLPLARANLPEPPVMKESDIRSYDDFWQKIEELEEINTTNEQVVCVFTTSVAQGSPEGNNDYNWLKSTILYVRQQVVPSGYLLWVRVGARRDWEDPNNPFKRDPQLKLKILPTIIVWNTEKRVAGLKVFDHANLTTLFED